MMTEREHPFGSVAQKDLAQKLRKTVEKLNFKVAEQNFEAEVPKPEAMAQNLSPMQWVERRQGVNLVVSVVEKTAENCVVIFGSHYDTKKISEGIYIGANDSASSTAGLIAALPKMKEFLKESLCRIDVVFFDGEESVLPEWNDGETKHPARIKDNTYGSRHFVKQLSQTEREKIKAFILLDMIGSPSVQLFLDQKSSPELLKKARDIAKKLGDPLLFDPLGRLLPIEDDHIPFREAGIPAIDLIDFKNLSHWHKPTDLPDKIDVSSVERVVKVALHLSQVI